MIGADSSRGMSDWLCCPGARTAQPETRTITNIPNNPKCVRRRFFILSLSRWLTLPFRGRERRRPVPLRSRPLQPRVSGHGDSPLFHWHFPEVK